MEQPRSQSCVDIHPARNNVDCMANAPRMSADWEKTYQRIIRIVSNPRKLARILQRWDFPKDAMILDLCCGTGESLLVFHRAGYMRLYGLDISHNLLLKVSGHFPCITADAHTCPMRTASFDIIIVHKALHHFFDHGPLLAEVKRLLKPDGRFCFIEPCKSWFRDLYHIVLMSPVINMLPPLVRLREAALIEEGLTYFQWLNTSHTFSRTLLDQFNFVSEYEKKDLLHYIGKFKSLP